MKKLFSILAPALILFLLPSTISAHPGRTASDGCHYCRTNCASWGEIEGARHCHNGGYTTSTDLDSEIQDLENQINVLQANKSTPTLTPTKEPTSKPTQAPTSIPTVEPVVLGVSATFEATASPIVSEIIEPKVAGDKKENPIIGLCILGVLVYGTIKFLGWKEKRLQKIV